MLRKNNAVHTAKQITNFYEIGLIHEDEYLRLMQMQDATGKMLRSLL